MQTQEHINVRLSDPETSHIASREVKPVLQNRAQQFIDGLKILKQATSNEVARQVAPNSYGVFNTIRRRASDLERDGVIHVVGTRRCSVTNRTASVYAITEDCDGPGSD